jgi:hypothetical protein
MDRLLLSEQRSAGLRQPLGEDGLADRIGTSGWFRRLVHKFLAERANGFALRRSAHQKINASAHREERFTPQGQCDQPLSRLERRHDVQLPARRKMAGQRAEARSKKGKSACGVHLPDLDQPRPPDLPPGLVRLRVVASND